MFRLGDKVRFKKGYGYNTNLLCTVYQVNSFGIYIEYEVNGRTHKHETSFTPDLLEHAAPVKCEVDYV